MGKFPSFIWDDMPVTVLAGEIARLAGLSSKQRIAEKLDEPTLRCIEYAKSLRTKNTGKDRFFSLFNIPDDTIPIICATILVVFHRDYIADPVKGFFGTLLSSRLSKPMPADLRRRWEKKFQLPGPSLHEIAAKSGQQSLEKVDKEDTGFEGMVANGKRTEMHVAKSMERG